MSASVTEIAAAGLGLAFAWAALAKVLAHRRWRRALAALELPAFPSAMAVRVIAPAELAVAYLLLSGPARAGALLAAALLAAFSIVLVRARLRRGDRLPCACFGGGGERDYRLLLARNAALSALAVIVLASGGEGRGLEALASPAAGDVLPLALAALGVAIAGWTMQQAGLALRRGDGR